jgi:hypothetical protein
MIVAWAVILIVITGVCAVWGGRNCQVPQSGPFHRLLAGHKFVPTHVGKYACIEVK